VVIDIHRSDGGNSINDDEHKDEIYFCVNLNQVLRYRLLEARNQKIATRSFHLSYISFSFRHVSDYHLRTFDKSKSVSSNDRDFRIHSSLYIPTASCIIFRHHKKISREAFDKIKDESDQRSHVVLHRQNAAWIFAFLANPLIPYVRPSRSKCPAYTMKPTKIMSFPAPRKRR